MASIPYEEPTQDVLASEAADSGLPYGVPADMESAGREKRRVLVNAAANWLGYAVAIAVAFFMSPILVHSLGDSRYGIWVLVDSVLAYLALADLGVGAAVLRYVARFEGLRDRVNLNRLFSTSLAIFLAAGIVALSTTLALAFLFSNPLGVADELVSDTRWLLVLLGVNLAMGLPLGIYGTVLSALRHYPLKNGIHVAVLLVRSGLLLLVLYYGGGIPGIAIVITACSLGEHLLYAWAAHCYLPGLRFSPRLANRTTLKSIFGYSTFVFIALIAGRVSFQSDAIVIAAFLTPEHITYFAIAAGLMSRARDCVITLTAVLTPTISNLEALGDQAGVRTVLVTGTRYVLYLAMPIQIGGLLFGYSFLSLWMGPRYADMCYLTLAILLAPLPITMSKNVSLRVLHGLGRVKLYSAFTVAEAVVNLLLSILLVLWLRSIEGPALGTAIPAVVQSLAVTVLACRVVGIHTGIHLARSFARPLLASGALLLVWFFVLRWMPPQSWGTLITAGLLGIVPYAAVVVALEPQVRNAIFHFAAFWSLGRSATTNTSGVESAFLDS